VESEATSWGAILTGGGIAIFAFVLAWIWDVIKSRRDARRRDKSVLVSARAEIDSLIATVTNNLNLVRSELELLEEDKSLVNPLDPVAGGFWEVVRTNLPESLIRDASALSQLTDVSRRTEQVSEMIRSREAFRVNNQAFSGLTFGLKSYDGLLERFQEELLAALNDLKPVIEAKVEALN
jgi:hypothetical protein